MCGCFKGCTFKNGLDLGEEFYIDGDVDTEEMFMNSKFYKFINLGSGFCVSSLNYLFAGAEFHEGCNLKDLKFIGNKEELRDSSCCLTGAYLGDNFYLPDEDFVSYVFDNYDEDYYCPKRMPSYAMSEERLRELQNLENIAVSDNVSADYIRSSLCMAIQRMRKGSEAIEKCGRQLKELLDSGMTRDEAVAEVTDSNYDFNVGMLSAIESGKSTDFNDCKKSILSLLKAAKSFKEVFCELSVNFDVVTISNAYSNIERSLIAKCDKDISDVFIIDRSTKSSKYTVGQLCEMLKGRGYPEDIICKCLVGYLKEEYLCE